MIASLVNLSKRREDKVSDEEFWGVLLNGFATDIVSRILPDDPVARQDVIRKARAIGIVGGDDGGPPRSGNVIDVRGRLKGR